MGSPIQTRKSCHVRIGRVELSLVLDSKAGEELAQVHNHQYAYEAE